MSHLLKVQLIEETPAKGRGRTKPVGEVLDEIEIEVDDQREGMDLMNDLGEILENDYGFEISEDVEN